MHNNTTVTTVMYADDLRQQRLKQLKPLKIFGAIHIALGIGIAILSTICVIIASGLKDSPCQLIETVNGNVHSYSYRNCRHYFGTLLLIFDAVCLFLSGWFVITGALPLCMTEKRERKWRCLKTAFMVCCILSAVLFGSTVTSLAAIGIVVSDDGSVAMLVMSILLTMTAFGEVVMAVAAASYCCCCSHLITTNHTSILPSNSSRTGIASMPQTHLPSNNLQGYPGMWLMPGQHGGQSVMYHVVGITPTQGGLSHNYIYPSAPVLSQTVTNQQTNSETGKTNNNS